MGHSKGSPEREVYSDTAYLKRIETAQINNLTLHLQELEEQQQRQPRRVEGGNYQDQSRIK